MGLRFRWSKSIFTSEMLHHRTPFSLGATVIQTVVKYYKQDSLLVSQGRPAPAAVCSLSVGQALQFLGPSRHCHERRCTRRRYLMLAPLRPGGDLQCRKRPLARAQQSNFRS